MTRLLISTAFAGLMFFGGSALAQDDHRGGPDHGGQGGDRHAGAPSAPAARPAVAPSAPAGGPGENRQGRAINPAINHAANNPQGDPRRDSGENRQGRAMMDHASGNNAPAPGNAMRGPSQDNRNAMRGPSNVNNGQRRDFSAYHRNFNAPRRFHASSYNRPRGWYAHRWTYGEILPSLFWASDFWLNDFNDYGLEPPPPGTVWVRDGDDAILIDRYSGEIIQVDYGVFY